MVDKALSQKSPPSRPLHSDYPSRDISHKAPRLVYFLLATLVPLTVATPLPNVLCPAAPQVCLLLAHCLAKLTFSYGLDVTERLSNPLTRTRDVVLPPLSFIVLPVQEAQHMLIKHDTPSPSSLTLAHKSCKTPRGGGGKKQMMSYCTGYILDPMIFGEWPKRVSFRVRWRRERLLITVVAWACVEVVNKVFVLTCA